jgi:hypothetical protein
MYTTYLVSYIPKKKLYVGAKAGMDKEVKTWKTKDDILKFANENPDVILAFQPRTLKHILECE